MAPKKTIFFMFFLKNLKSSKVHILGFLGLFVFLVKFYPDHIKFHILVVICEFCAKNSTERERSSNAHFNIWAVHKSQSELNSGLRLTGPLIKG